MQVLSFVNVAGPEAWKNDDRKRLVRSHAMKDFRRKQREQKKKKTASPCSESSFKLDSVALQRPAIPKQETAQIHEIDQAVGPCDIPPPIRSIEKRTSHTKSIPSPRLPPAVQDVLDQAASPTQSCSQLPRIFPLSPPLSPASLQNPTTGSLIQNRSHNFDLTVSVAVYACLDRSRANFEQFTSHFFRSVHSYLTIIHRPRFLERVKSLSQEANAETSLLLLCMHLCSEPTRSGIAASAGPNYTTAKALFRSTCAAKPPCIELIQAGALLTLFEHNADLHGSDLETLRACSQMATSIGLEALPNDSNSVADEERRRLHWALLSLDCTLSLHDERHEHPLLFPVPSPDDVLPSILDSDYDESLAELPATSTGFLVQSRLPNWADGFSRQGQAIRLLYMVLNLVREPFDRCPDLMLSRIEHLDSLIVTALGNLLADCNGKATQYCCPISCCLSASYLLHEYQLLSTMHTPSKKADDTQAPTRSKLAIETMIDMLVNILREFPLSHTPELSSTALFCPYKAAMLGLLLDRIRGLNRAPTIVGTTLELMVNGLRHFSTVWPCTARYIKIIERAQSRALPAPAIMS